MIHRWIDIVGEAAIPIWPIMVEEDVSSVPTWFIYLIGAGLPPVRLDTSTKDETNGFISDPRLSPDETQVVYGYAQDPGVPANYQELTLVLTDDSVGQDIFYTPPIVPITPNQQGMWCAWRPDGSQIAYAPIRAALTGTSSRGQVNVVDPDGSNPATLWTAASNSRFVREISYSPSGDYIAFMVQLLSPPNQVWIMEADGSNPVQVASTGNQGLIRPSWQRGADVLGFMDDDLLGAGRLWRTCNPDGTGAATFYTDSSRIYSGPPVFGWLSDDSGRIALKNIGGGDNELAVIDAGGGGPTDSGLTTGAGSGFFDPWVAVTAQEPPRIYYPEADASGDIMVVSVLESFAGYRVDFSPDAVGNDSSTDGIFGVSS